MRRRDFLQQTAFAAAALCVPSPTIFAFDQKSAQRRDRRYFIGRGEAEFDRIHGGSPRRDASGRQIFTDLTTGEQWQEWFDLITQFAFLAGLARLPFPSVDTLFDICRGSNNLEDVAFATLVLNESVDSRWRLLDLVEALVEQSPTSARLKVLLDNGVFEFPLCHEIGVGMMAEEIKRQYELSLRCAKRAVALRKRLSPHRRPMTNRPNQAMERTAERCTFYF